MGERAYIAFISYRHAPLDMQVARKLHRMIEHYRIPRGVQTERPGRRLGYVFRDQEELGVSSDLSGDITDALEKARYLIVICTPDTPGSEWVRREISRFIALHGRARVLCVLAAGTPETSFPPELLTDEKGAQVEPLAANIVADGEAQTLRALDKEKLRIMAALLGCGYDDLVRRERTWRRRRRIAIALAVSAIALAFIGMLLIKNREITRQNEELVAQGAEITAKNNKLLHDQVEILRQQNSLEAENKALQGRVAEALSAHAATALAARDLPGALRLSIEAAQAGDAATADTLYRVLGLDGSGEPALLRLWQREAPLQAFCCAPDESLLVTLDENGTVCCYALSDGSNLWTARSEADAALYPMDSVALLAEEKGVRAFDLSSGAEAWYMEDARPIAVRADGSLTALWTGRQLRIVNARGETLCAFDLAGNCAFVTGSFDAAGDVFAGAYQMDGKAQLCLVSLSDEHIAVWPAPSEETPLGILPTADGALLVVSSDGRQIIARRIDGGDGSILGESALTPDDGWADAFETALPMLMSGTDRVWVCLDRYLFSIDPVEGTIHCRVCAAALLSLEAEKDGFTALLADGSLLAGTADDARIIITQQRDLRRVPSLAGAIALGGGPGTEGGSMLCLPEDARDALLEIGTRPEAVIESYNTEDILRLGWEVLYGLRDAEPEGPQEGIRTERSLLADGEAQLAREPSEETP